MLSTILENIGLTNKEAKVYLAALEVGTSPISKIATKAKINRVTTYDITEKLIKRGLINFFTKAKIKFFTATDPEIVVNEYNKRMEDLQKALPELKRLHGETIHPKVRYYEGLEGIKSIYADTLTSKTEILNYCNSKETRREWAAYDDEYVKERANRKIFLRGIAPNDEYGKLAHAQDEQFLREIRLSSKELYNFTNEINIYDDKVAIISFKDELIGMIIESPEIANTQRALFAMIWEFCGQQTPELIVRKIGGLKNVKEKAVAESKPVLEGQSQLF